MKELATQIRNCTICQEYLVDGCRPVFAANRQSKIVIIGQAPGRKVHESGIPWQDKSGENLRKWLGVTEAEFYDARLFAIVPMGFCFPGTGKSGDLAPRKECAPQWHEPLLEKMPQVQLTLLIGQYAQKYYLGKKTQKNLTETVRNYKTYFPKYFPLPHPSPRNNIWMKKNAWFASDLLPILRDKISSIK